MTTKTEMASKLYAKPVTGPTKRKPKDALITHPAGGGSKVAQQQKPAVKTTARPNNAAVKK